MSMLARYPERSSPWTRVRPSLLWEERYRESEVTSGRRSS